MSPLLGKRETSRRKTKLGGYAHKVTSKRFYGRVNRGTEISISRLSPLHYVHPQPRGLCWVAMKWRGPPICRGFENLPLGSVRVRVILQIRSVSCSITPKGALTLVQREVRMWTNLFFLSRTLLAWCPSHTETYHRLVKCFTDSQQSLHHRAISTLTHSRSTTTSKGFSFPWLAKNPN